MITAAKLYEYLEHSICRISKKYDLVLRDLDSFRYGRVEKIQERLNSPKNAGEDTKKKGLVPLVDKHTKRENMEYLRSKYNKITNRNHNNPIEENSYGLGKIVKGKISLNDQIKKD